MKKNLTFLFVYIFCLQGFSQLEIPSMYAIENNFKNNDKDISEMNITTKKVIGDSIYLNKKENRYLWEDGHYELTWVNYREYYDQPSDTGYSLMKLHGSLTTYTNDSLNELEIKYDEFDRFKEMISTEYDSILNTWVNSIRTLYYYDKWGFDSAIIRKKWDAELMLWENDQQQIFIRDEYGSIVQLTTQTWSGNDWQIVDGEKSDLFRNDNNCVDSIYFKYWLNGPDYWSLYKKWYLYYDENDIQVSGLEVVYDPDIQKWRNNQRTLEYEFQTWCGCTYQENCESQISHFIIQNWYDTAWFNIEEFYGTYDSLGGRQIFIDLYNHEISEWVKWTYLDEKFIEEGVLDYWLMSEWDHNSWVGDYGSKITYLYENNLLTEINVEHWSTAINNWEPFMKIDYLDYIALPIINAGLENYKVEKNELIVIPNPAKETVTIKTNNKMETITSVEIITTTGISVFKNTFKNNLAEHQKINISALRKGVYVLKALTSDNRVFTSKLVKK